MREIEHQFISKASAVPINVPLLQQILEGDRIVFNFAVKAASDDGCFGWRRSRADQRKIAPLDVAAFAFAFYQYRNGFASDFEL